MISTDPAVLTNLARSLQMQGRMEEAVAAFRRVAELRPDLALAHVNLGVVLCEAGRLEESFASFRRHAELEHGAAPPPAAEPAHKIRHDREQREYLKAQGIAAAFHIETGGRIAGRAVQAKEGAAGRWQKNYPRIVVIDDFLTAAALDGLRRYCLGSTMWREVYAGGYLGAMPQHGLGSPLLAQIAEELRDAYPAIFGTHPLRQFWAFKYDSRMSGIAVHADAAVVNVNFWITPDEANRDPESGGLVIWDKAAPADWDFRTYNDDVTATRRFLKQVEAKPMRIPYRCNRAVIFDSGLFHETDRIDFKSGYLDRRINLTLLYGRRD
ncbi:MAG: tetratricopeptide repeat protein [Bdellovibrionales bacterium]